MSLPDHLHDLLFDSTHGPVDSADRVLREKVLARTTGVLRTRRRIKRAGAILALAGCYVAGALTMAVLHVPAVSMSAARGSAGGLTAENSVDLNTAPAVTRPLVRPEDDGVVT